MKCKVCGYEWETAGEQLRCPSCNADGTLPQNEQQQLWSEAEFAKKAKKQAIYASKIHLLAEQGNKKAECLYGELLTRGEGVAQNLAEAKQWYLRSARQLYAHAAYKLAELLRDKRAGGDPSTVFFWLKVGAEFGDSEAAYALAHCYEEGVGVEPSHRHAVYYLTESAKKDNEAACFALAKLYAEGEGIKKDPDVARELMAKVKDTSLATRRFIRKLGKGGQAPLPDVSFPQLLNERFRLGETAAGMGELTIAANVYFLVAKTGNPDANLLLGRCYETGAGVPQSEEMARTHFRLAAEAGLEAGAIAYFACLCEGKGGEKNTEEAAEVLKTAAENGGAEAAFRLAEAYREGKLGKLDLPAAMKWYEKAAGLGHREAAAEVQEIKEVTEAVYRKGLSAAEGGDEKEAYRLFAQAAVMGHAGACCRMGIMLRYGLGCRRDLKKSVKYLRSAAEQGHPEAIYELGVAYMEGLGVPANYKDAAAFLSVAAKQNTLGAADRLALMKKRKMRKMARTIYSLSSLLYLRGDTLFTRESCNAF
ncbi:MAG: hypothetical protein MJ078_04405, partial [Clostridia bacterium]|nr:hypothetical protein [Clostridia bacterium]